MCGKDLLELPIQLTTGDIISYANDRVTEGKMDERYTFSGSVYFERMKELGLYTINKEDIKERVSSLNLTNIFNSQEVL